MAGWRHLSRPGADVRPDRPRRPGLESDAGRQNAAAAHEGATTRHQLRHEREVPGARTWSPSDDRQRSHHPASTALPDVLDVARRDGAARDVAKVYPVGL